MCVCVGGVGVDCPFPQQTISFFLVNRQGDFGFTRKTYVKKYVVRNAKDTSKLKGGVNKALFVTQPNLLITPHN